MKSVEFRQLHCSVFHCAPTEFEGRVLRHCLYLHARPLAAVIEFCNPDYFEWDRRLIRNVGRARDLHQVDVEISAFPHADRLRGLFRGLLRFRCSSRRLSALAEEVFEDASEASPPEVPQPPDAT